MKKTKSETKKLKLSTETLRTMTLDIERLTKVVGGTNATQGTNGSSDTRDK